jgi:hypothetical protein
MSRYIALQPEPRAPDGAALHRVTAELFARWCQVLDSAIRNSGVHSIAIQRFSINLTGGAALMQCNEEPCPMSDHSIAAIARCLAAALISDNEILLVAEVEALRKRREQKQIAKLEDELCAEYREETIEMLKV